jgi:RimJ/RimL family protein N-acetyltransferase
MEWVVEKDLAGYVDRVLPWLERSPVWNTVPATVLRTRRDGTIVTADPWLAWLDDGTGAVAGAALRTPPRGMLIPRLPAGAAAGLAEVAPPDLPEAAGPSQEVAEFAAAYAARVGATARPQLHLRLYELTEPLPPAAPAGAVRVAEEADVELCVRWFAEFLAETAVHSDGDPDAMRRVIEQGRMWLWQDGETPVCLVGHSPTVGAVTRIGPVWTPPRHRRRGYAAATTAAVSRRLLDRGRVVLFADLANPTSTGVYLRVGFRPVGDWDEWRLEH